MPTIMFRTLPSMVLTFPTGLPGLPGAHRFQLAPLGADDTPNPFGRLVALEPVQLADRRLVEGIGVNVVAVGVLWPDLSVDIDDTTEAVLALDHPDDVAMLAVVTLHEPVQESTANLFAPILINTRRAVAVQFVPNAAEAAVGRLIHTPLPFLPVPA
jgi:flagellar assembly factor FliW